MGVLVEVNGRPSMPSSFSVTEDSTPLAGGDSSGSVGGIEFRGIPSHYGMSYTDLRKEVKLEDTERGFTLGSITDLAPDRETDQWDVTATSRLAEFVIEVQAAPFSGTLEQAFMQYCSLANISTDVLVDDDLKEIPVNFPGFSGNLWTNLKEMAVGQGAEITLVSGVIKLKKLRSFEAVQNMEFSSGVSLSQGSLARKQEVVWSETSNVYSGLVYPAGGWNRDVRVYSVDAGSEAEFILETEASIFSLDQPQMRLSVGPEYVASSVFTVVGDDNLPIPPQMWDDYGGQLKVSISEDTRSIILNITGPEGIYQVNGEPMKTFRLALSAGSSDSTYSTLRITGNFVRIKRNSIIIPTGVPDWLTGQEFAPTIESDWINDLNSAYSAGVRGARRYAGRTFNLSASVAALNKIGIDGVATYPTYADANQLWSGLTYAQVDTLNAGLTYAQVRENLYDSVRSSGDNQVFGNTPGARFWDEWSRRWFRIRSATTTWDSISIEGDDDTLHSDYQEVLGGMTYAQVNALMAGKTYLGSILAGVPVVVP